MSRPKIAAKTNADRTETAVEITTNDGKLATAFLDAADVEEFIEILSDSRASLIDEVPRELDGTIRKQFIINADWHVQDRPDAPGKLILVRHPGQGWLGFVLRPEVAQQLASLLQT